MQWVFGPHRLHKGTAADMQLSWLGQFDLSSCGAIKIDAS